MRLRSLLVPKALLEVVLYSPAEAVLAPYIDRAPSPTTKQWFATNFKNWLVKSPENLFKLPYLPRNATEKQTKAHSFNDLYDLRLSPATETMIEHILDYFRMKPDPPRLERMSVENVVQAADNEMRQYNAQIAKQANKDGGIPDDPKGVHTIMEFPGGYRMAELTTQKALDREGAIMGHCVGQLHGCYIKDKSRRIFSLRDAENMPHTTIEVYSDGMNTTEIKGRQNAAPVRRYWPLLRQFIAQYGVMVDNDHRNLGLLKIHNDHGGEDTMTQDEFRDMVLDPEHERGKEMLARYAQRPQDYIHDADLAMGMFTALYGTEQLNDTTIRAVFQHSASDAIQVVQHFGNRFDAKQLTIAFTAMRPVYGQKIAGLYKTLLISTKPDALTCNAIIDALADSYGRREGMDSEFVTALSVVLPETYLQIMADPKAVERELETKNQRAAGPFFVFSATDQLTMTMIGKAFHFMPEEAMKRVKRDGLKLDMERFRAIIEEISGRYWRGDSGEVNKLLTELISYAQPDADMLRSALDGIENQDFAANFLISAKQLVPDAVDAEVMEKAVIKIDKSEMYQRYLMGEPNPSLAIQQLMLKKDMADRQRDDHMQYLRQIDASLFEPIYKTLTPDPIPTKKDDYRSVKIDPPPPAGQSTYTQVKYERPLNDEEKFDARSRNRREARQRFLDLLGSAVREPTDQSDSFIKPDGDKYRTARAAFAALGKEKLFDTAINRLNHKLLIRRITPDYGRGGDRPLFIEHLDTLPAIDIARIIDNGRSGELFGVLVNHAPYRVPEVIRTAVKGGYHRDIGNQGHYGKFDYHVDKEKAFEALEAVWSSPSVPEGLKDDFTLKVFKRFKPKPDRLITMLEKADSEGATEYVLKKTKKPSPILVRWVFNSFPNLLLNIPLASIPAAVLKDTFVNEKGRIARALMDRDLRGYGTDSRRRWASSDFRTKINRTSEAFATYENAAKAAGMEAAFTRYARQAELEDTHPQLTGGDEENSKINMQLLTQHLDEYSNRTLVHVAQNDTSGAVQALYFARFTPQKLVGLIKNDTSIFKAGNYWNRDQTKGITKKVDATKLRTTLRLALQQKKEVKDLIKTMVEDKFEFGDDLIIDILEGDPDYEVTNSLIKRENSDRVKNWIADNKPTGIADISDPTPYIITKLYDNYGNLVRDYQKRITVNSMFSKAVCRWFSADGYFFKFKPNPPVLKMLTDEAKRRQGDAVFVMRTMLHYLVSLKKQTANKEYVSAGTPILTTVPHGIKIGEDD